MAGDQHPRQLGSSLWDNPSAQWLGRCKSLRMHRLPWGPRGTCQDPLPVQPEKLSSSMTRCLQRTSYSRPSWAALAPHMLWVSPHGAGSGSVVTTQVWACLGQTVHSGGVSWSPRASRAEYDWCPHSHHFHEEAEGSPGPCLRLPSGGEAGPSGPHALCPRPWPRTQSLTRGGLFHDGLSQELCFPAFALVDRTFIYFILIFLAAEGHSVCSFSCGLRMEPRAPHVRGRRSTAEPSPAQATALNAGRSSRC